MKKLLLFSALCLTFLSAYSQEDTRVFNIVEKSARPEGGMQAFYKYASDSLKYPSLAQAKKIEGKVFLSFIIEKDGSLTNIKVERGIGGGCDEEAVRLIKEAQKWNPGMQRGEAIRQKMTLPITFKWKKKRKKK